MARLGTESSAAEKAAWALYDACFDNQANRGAVRAAGGVPALVALLQDSVGGPVRSAAWALAQLIQGSREAAEVREVFKKVIRLLAGSTWKWHGNNRTHAMMAVHETFALQAPHTCDEALEGLQALNGPEAQSFQPVRTRHCQRTLNMLFCILADSVWGNLCSLTAGSSGCGRRAASGTDAAIRRHACGDRRRCGMLQPRLQLASSPGISCCLLSVETPQNARSNGHIWQPLPKPLWQSTAQPRVSLPCTACQSSVPFWW